MVHDIWAPISSVSMLVQQHDGGADVLQQRGFMRRVIDGTVGLPVDLDSDSSENELEIPIPYEEWLELKDSADERRGQDSVPTHFVRHLGMPSQRHLGMPAKLSAKKSAYPSSNQCQCQC